MTRQSQQLSEIEKQLANIMDGVEQLLINREKEEDEEERPQRRRKPEPDRPSILNRLSARLTKIEDANFEEDLEILHHRLAKLEAQYTDVLTTQGPRVHPQLFDNVCDRLDALESQNQEAHDNRIEIKRLVVNQGKTLERVRKSAENFDLADTRLTRRLDSIHNMLVDVTKRVQVLETNQQADPGVTTRFNMLEDEFVQLRLMVQQQNATYDRAIAQLRRHLDNEVERLHQVRAELDESLSRVINHPLHADDVNGLKKALAYIETLIAVNTPGN